MEITGYGALLSGERANNVTIAQMRLSTVSYLTIRDRWNRIEPNEDVYDWSWIDKWVKMCHTVNKPYKLLPMTGKDCSPLWEW